MLQGELIRGRLLGFRSDSMPYVDKETGVPKQFTKNEIGIGISRPDGFGGVTQQTLYLRLSDRQMQKRLGDTANSLKGKLVEIPFEKRVRARFDKKSNKEIVEEEWYLLGEEFHLVEVGK